MDLESRPWENEPDHAYWVEATSSHPCFVLRGPLGALNGYVGVPKGHPLHGLVWEDEAYDKLNVHGGITFLGEADFPWQPRDYIVRDWYLKNWSSSDWVFGFDTMHYGDLIPGVLDTVAKISENTQGALEILGVSAEDTYKDINYVRNETSRLARMLG